MKSREDRRRETGDLGLWMLGTVAALLVLYVLVEGPPTSCEIGYAISVVGGIPITYTWSEFLFSLLERYVPRTAKEIETGEVAGLERIWWIVMMVGIFERAVITTLVAYDVEVARISRHGSPSKWRLDGRGGAREHDMPGPQRSWRCWVAQCQYSWG